MILTKPCRTTMIMSLLCSVIWCAFGSSDTVHLRAEKDPTSIHCSVQHRNDHSLSLSITTANQTNYVIELNRELRDLTWNAKHTALDENQNHVAVDVQHHAWYSGHVANINNSTARLHIDRTTPDACDDLSGVVFISGIMYVVGRSKNGVLRMEHEANHLPNMDLPKPTECQALDPEVMDQAMWNMTLPTQRKRRGINHKACMVFLDADWRFTVAHRGDCIPGDTMSCWDRRMLRVTIKMIDLLHMVDAIYRADPTIKNLIQLHLAGTYIHTSSGIISDNVDPSVGSSQYKEWLAPNGVPAEKRGAGSLRANQVCLNHLLTHTDFVGSTVGIAYTGGGDFNSGGVCGLSGRNSGITSTNSNGNTMAHWYTVRVMAHEIGHNVGASHDSGSCLAQSYIMTSSISNNRYDAAGSQFSTCSRSAIYDAITKLGNGRRPDNCLGDDSNPCHGDGDKGCCRDGSLLPQGTTCREMDPLLPCIAAAECDGVRPECPRGKERPNGADCDMHNSNHGECHEGVCSHLNAGYCDAYMASHGYGSAGGCSFEGNECVRACFSSSGRCIATGKECGLSLYTFGDIAEEGCPKAAVNSPCTVNGVDGTCTAMGTCEACPNGVCGLHYGETDVDIPEVGDWSRPPTPAPVCVDSTFTGYRDSSSGAPISCPDLINRYRVPCNDGEIYSMCPVSCNRCLTRSPNTAAPTTKRPTSPPTPAPIAARVACPDGACATSQSRGYRPLNSEL